MPNINMDYHTYISFDIALWKNIGGFTTQPSITEVV